MYHTKKIIYICIYNAYVVKRKSQRMLWRGRFPRTWPPLSYSIYCQLAPVVLPATMLIYRVWCVLLVRPVDA